MLNKILFWVLTRFYRMNPDFANPVNWRLAHPAEHVSIGFKYQPLIFKGWKGKPQYGFENVVFMANGRIYLAPNRVPKEYGIEIPKPESVNEDYWKFSQITGLNGWSVNETLLKAYMELNPHIVLNKFPCKLLRLLIKRNIPIVKALKDLQRQKDVEATKMSASQAIQSDLQGGLRESTGKLISQHASDSDGLSKLPD